MDEINVSEEVLFDLVEEITNKLHAGESLDLDAYSREYPEYIERLRAVLPSLELFAEFGRSSKSELLTLPEALNDDSIPGVLGEYEIVREVGRGGMGVVYEAQNRSLGRRVALKVLPLAAMLDPRQIQRFKNEAQIVAQLDHDHIVDVFGVGCDRGVHFYAMRFINGRTLSEMIVALKQNSLREHVDAAETPRNHGNSTSQERASQPTDKVAPETTKGSGDTNAAGTSLLASLSEKHSTRSPAYVRSVAELVRQAADALEHAHRQSVIHRDVKPSNLMLEDTGKLWVTDFGLAHIESAASLTLTGDVVGTLRYMSPEQAKGVPIDHRSDIYSLGATLYELLTLRPAFPQHERHELFQKIASEDPVSPRHFNRAISADLETIVLKSLQKDPAERYETAASFANDLLCFMEDRPIAARRPTVVDRVAKWSRRHRSFVAATAVVLLVSLIALTASTLFMARVAQVATRERNEARSQRTRAVANERLALQALDEMFMDVFERRFPSEQLTAKDHALVEKALDYYQGFARQNERYATSRHETAKAYRRVGDLQTRLARHEEAEESYRKSIQFYEDLAQDFPQDPDFLYGLASSTNSLGLAFWSQEDYSAAEDAFSQALATDLDLVKRHGDRRHYREELARLSNNLGAMLAELKRYDEAEQAFLSARERWQDLLEESNAHSPYRHHLAASHINLANLWLSTDRRDDAQQAIEQALSITRGLTESMKRPEYQEQLARVLNSIGVLAMKDGNTVRSESAFQEAIPVWQELADQYINVPNYGLEFVRTCDNLATLVRNSPEATDWHRRGRDALQRLTERFPDQSDYLQQLAEINVRLGESLRSCEQTHEATEAYLAASTQWKRLIVETSQNDAFRQQLSKTCNVLGILYSTSGKPSEARAAYDDALRALDEMSGEQAELPAHRDAVAKICHNLGLLIGTTDVNAAEKLLRRGQSAFLRLRKDIPTNPTYQHALASSHTALGNLLFETERPEEAEEQFGQALTLREELAAKFPRVAGLHNSLAWFLVTCADTNLRDVERGLEHARRAVELSADDKGFWNTLGVAEYRTGDYPAAIESLKAARPDGSSGEANDLFYLAMSYQQLGQAELARLHFDQACAWMDENRPNDLEQRRFRREASTLLEIQPDRDAKNTSDPEVDRPLSETPG